MTSLPLSPLLCRSSRISSSLRVFQTYPTHVDVCIVTNNAPALSTVLRAWALPNVTVWNESAHLAGSTEDVGHVMNESRRQQEWSLAMHDYVHKLRRAYNYATIKNHYKEQYGLLYKHRLSMGIAAKKK